MSDGFDPLKSQANPETLGAFLAKPVDDAFVMKDMPGVGDTAVAKFAADGVETIYQLIAKFLSMKTDGLGCREHMDRMYFYLKGIGISAHRNTIIDALARKLQGIFPDIYDSTLWGEDEED